MLILQAPSWDAALWVESHAGSTYGFISVAKTGHRHAVIKQTAPIHFITYIELFIGGFISRSSFDTDAPIITENGGWI